MKRRAVVLDVGINFVLFKYCSIITIINSLSLFVCANALRRPKKKTFGGFNAQNICRCRFLLGFLLLRLHFAKMLTVLETSLALCGQITSFINVFVYASLTQVSNTSRIVLRMSCGQCDASIHQSSLHHSFATIRVFHLFHVEYLDYWYQWFNHYQGVFHAACPASVLVRFLVARRLGWSARILSELR